MKSDKVMLLESALVWSEDYMFENENSLPVWTLLELL